MTMTEENARNAIEQTFSKSVDSLCKAVHYDNVERGWWDMGVENRNKAEMIALMHSELSEALECLRKPDMKDEHLPEENAVGLELADTLIRMMDYCGAYDINLGELVIKKLAYNRTRAHKHGGKAF